MTRVYLIRHAEAEGNLYRRIHGHYDSHITPNGYRQIHALKERFSSVAVDAVYSSDLNRTMTTAGAIYLPKDLPLNIDPRLKEIGMGEWEDVPFGKVGLSQPEQMKMFSRSDPEWFVPGCEPFPAVQERVREGVLDIARRHNGQTVAIFSHGTAIRTLLAYFHGYPLTEIGKVRHGDNTSVALVEVDGEKGNIIFENDNSHLSDETSTFARQSWWRRKDGASLDFNLWFRPWDPVEEQGRYREYRREAWENIHGSMEHYPEERFYQDALQQSRAFPEGVCIAMLGKDPAGLIQLDLQRWRREGVGMIAFCYMAPDFRRQGMGVQLIGQAVSVLRREGFSRMRLRCAPDNDVAQRFYRRYGFQKTGCVPDTPVPLDYLEMDV